MKEFKGFKLFKGIEDMEKNIYNTVFQDNPEF